MQREENFVTLQSFYAAQARISTGKMLGRLPVKPFIIYNNVRNRRN